MNRPRRSILLSVALMVLAALFMGAATAQAQSPQQTLNQYVSDLQKNPNDYALREKIIRHVQTMKPAPVVPLEAEKFEGRAEFAIKNAKTETDFLDAAKEYEKALLIAPWVPAYYFNQGIAFEKAGKPSEAKRSFEFYLLAAPNVHDARDVRKRIAGLEYAIEKAAQGSAPQATAEKKQNTFDDLLKRMDGRRYTHTRLDAQGSRYTMVIDISGRVFRVGVSDPQYAEQFRDEIRGRETIVPVNQRMGTIVVLSRSYTISDDGRSILYRVRYSDGDVRDFMFVWQQ